MNFSRIPERSELKDYLRQLVDQKKIPHAQLFLGRPGYGTLALAMAYVNYLLCQNRNGGDSCGQCSSCIKTYKLIHPDVHFAFPVVKKDDKKREDTTSADFYADWRTIIAENPYFGINEWQEHIHSSTRPNINTRECNAIIQNLSLKAYEAPYKIQIIWMADYLGKESNRLLKLIEEPTDDTLIILIAENQELLLNTIISRCQITKVTRYQDTAIQQFLEEQYYLTADRSLAMAKLADGDLNRAIHLVKGEVKNFAQTLLHWLRISYKGDSFELMQFSQELGNWGLDLQMQFLEYGLVFFREFIFCTYSGRESVNLTSEENDVIQKLMKIIDSKKAEAIVEIINDAIIYLNRNANSKILLMADSIQIGDILRDRPPFFNHNTITLV